DRHASVLERDRAGGNARGWRHGAHRRRQGYSLAAGGGVGARRQFRGRGPTDEELSGDVEQVGGYGVDTRPPDVGTRNAEHVRGAADDRVWDRRLANISGRRNRRGWIPLQEGPDVGVGEGEREVTRGRSSQAALVVRRIDSAGRRRDDGLAAEGIGEGVRRARHETAVYPDAQASEHDLSGFAVRDRERWPAKCAFQGDAEIRA